MHFLMGLYILISTNAKKLISAVKRSKVKIFTSFIIHSGPFVYYKMNGQGPNYAYENIKQTFVQPLANLGFLERTANHSFVSLK